MSGTGKLSVCVAVLVVGLTACSDILDILDGLWRAPKQMLYTEEGGQRFIRASRR